MPKLAIASTRKIMLLGLSFFLALAPAAVWSDVGKQGSPAAAQNGFGETVDVRIVNVEAVVTDRKATACPVSPRIASGSPSTATRSIEYFAEIRGGDAVAPATSGEKKVGWQCRAWCPASRSRPAIWCSSTSTSR